MNDTDARAIEFTKYLVAGFPELSLKGLSLKGACAACGNAWQENLVRPVTQGRLDHGSNGVLQWRAARLDGVGSLRWFAQVHQMPWATLKTQAAFTLFELARDYKALYAELQEGAKPLETMTANFMNAFERPAAQYAALDNRIHAAKHVYALMSQEPAPAKIADHSAKITGASVAVVGASAAAAHYAHFGDVGWLVGIAVVSAAIGAMIWAHGKVAAPASPTALPAPVPVTILAGSTEPLSTAPASPLAAALAAAEEAKKSLVDAVEGIHLERDNVTGHIADLQKQFEESTAKLHDLTDPNYWTGVRLSSRSVVPAIPAPDPNPEPTPPAAIGGQAPTPEPAPDPAVETAAAALDGKATA